MNSALHPRKPSAPQENEGVEVRDVLGRLSDKWTLYVVCNLKDGPRRFNELRRNIEGISQRMLALTLRSLEQNGLVLRTVCQTTPLRVTYELTALGQTLVEPAGALLSWAETHMDNIVDSRRVFEEQEDRPSGN